MNPNWTTNETAREELGEAIRSNLSPDGVATAIVFLRVAENGNRPRDARALAALRQVEWLADTLTDMLGVDEHDRLMNELGL